MAAPAPSPAHGLAARIARHEAVRAAIARWSDDALRRALSGSEALLRDGHATLQPAGTGVPVFVKLVPLTALELEPQHVRSTANFFELPSCYQYRLGSYGFGAWREIEAHEIANRWVLSGECDGFALLHAWRVLPLELRAPDHDERMRPWGEDPAMRRRGAAVAESTHCVALFLERFPRNLLQQSSALSPDDPESSSRVWETEARILEILAFAGSRGVLHLDPHFENIMTDGESLFLTDWGLALSRTFDLDEAARAFYERHASYDRCTAITSLVHSVTSHLYPQGDWLPTLRALVDGTHEALGRLSDTARSYVAQRGPVAVAYTSFYRRLIADLTTEYPSEELQALLDRP